MIIVVGVVLAHLLIGGLLFAFARWDWDRAWAEQKMNSEQRSSRKQHLEQDVQQRGQERQQRGQERQQHNERIYRDFEFFVKIFMALVAAVGYITFNEHSWFHEHTTGQVVSGSQQAGSTAQASESTTIDPTAQNTAGYAKCCIAVLGSFTMFTLAVFVIFHQASKIRRFDKDDRKSCSYWLHWLEPYMILAMLSMAGGLWYLALTL